MKYRYSQIPVFADSGTYESATRRMTDKVMAIPGVHSVYQVGGVSAPGISDLDLVVIFKKGTKYLGNPVKDLDFPDNNLFIHRLFGTTEDRAVIIEKFTFFGNYRHIAGELINFKDFAIDPEEEKLIRNQVAIEYLVKAWINIASAIHLRDIKVRSFLLHAKAVHYDLDFLNLECIPLRNCIDEIINIRNSWFSDNRKSKELEPVIDKYYRLLYESINTILSEIPFYLPHEANLRISKRVTIKPVSDSLEMQVNCIPFLNNLPFLDKINRRLTYFTFRLPVKRENIPSIIKERHNILREAFEYNRENLPAFIPTGHGMNVFI